MGRPDADVPPDLMAFRAAAGDDVRIVPRRQRCEDVHGVVKAGFEAEAVVVGRRGQRDVRIFGLDGLVDLRDEDVVDFLLDARVVRIRAFAWRVNGDDVETTEHVFVAQAFQCFNRQAERLRVAAFGAAVDTVEIDFIFGELVYELVENLIVALLADVFAPNLADMVAEIGGGVQRRLVRQDEIENAERQRQRRDRLAVRKYLDIGMIDAGLRVFWRLEAEPEGDGFMWGDFRGLLEIENRIGPPALVVGGVWRLLAFHMADDGDADGVGRQRIIAVGQRPDGDGRRRLTGADSDDLDAFIFILSHF